MGTACHVMAPAMSLGHLSNPLNPPNLLPRGDMRRSLARRAGWYPLPPSPPCPRGQTSNLRQQRILGHDGASCNDKRSSPAAESVPDHDTTAPQQCLLHTRSRMAHSGRRRPDHCRRQWVALLRQMLDRPAMTSPAEPSRRHCGLTSRWSAPAPHSQNDRAASPIKPSKSGHFVNMAMCPPFFDRKEQRT